MPSDAKKNEQTIKIDKSEPPGFEYCPELEAEDPFFNRATQAELQRRAADMDAGRNCGVRNTKRELQKV